MSTTTTSQTPESEGPSRAGGSGSARLIHNEATMEIPVHLLFRDDPDPAPVPLGPAVVGRRQSTGEQPRFRRPVAAKPRPAPQVDAELAERPARVLPGTAGVFAGACGVAGGVADSWGAGGLTSVGILPVPAGDRVGGLGRRRHEAARDRALGQLRALEHAADLPGDDHDHPVAKVRELLQVA